MLRPRSALLALTLVLVPASADQCPGGELACPEPSVCCRTDSEQQPFICCPYTNGVCCGDGRHCCRQGQSAGQLTGLRSDCGLTWAVSPARY